MSASAYNPSSPGTSTCCQSSEPCAPSTILGSASWNSIGSHAATSVKPTTVQPTRRIACSSTFGLISSSAAKRSKYRYTRTSTTNSACHSKYNHADVCVPAPNSPASENTRGNESTYKKSRTDVLAYVRLRMKMGAYDDALYWL